jgi:hypothetical protein
MSVDLGVCGVASRLALAACGLRLAARGSRLAIMERFGWFSVR